MGCYSYSCYEQHLVADIHPFHAGFLILIEIEAEHIASIQSKSVHVFHNLLFAFFMISLPVLHFS